MQHESSKYSKCLMFQKTLHGLDLCLGRLHKWVSGFCLQLGIVFMSLMTLAVFIQVIMRYIFSRPISWIEEFCIYSMFFLAFLLSPYIVLHRLHISMTMFYEKIRNPKVRMFVDILLEMVSIAGIYTIMGSIIEVVYNSMKVTTTQMPLTKGQIYLVVPFSFILAITISAQHILANLLAISKTGGEA